eukprot:GAFH01003967.1.p1 GENE.GAFH01003967.1~~GAFH01003967.1.p1  ORF type:complete len:263 (-),score=51.05 GAFH01003967.1:67-744(-)
MMDLLGKRLDACNYIDLYADPAGFGISDPMPQAPIFSDCNVLFEAMNNPVNPNYKLYQDFIRWWDHALASCLLTGADTTLHFNLAGFSAARVKMAVNRYERLLADPISSTTVTYGSPYKCVQHLYFSRPWTAEERAIIGIPEGSLDIYPGFTDWDLAFVLHDPHVLAHTHFYNIPNPAALAALPAEGPLPQLTREQLLADFGIVLPPPETPTPTQAWEARGNRWF